MKTLFNPDLRAQPTTTFHHSPLSNRLEQHQAGPQGGLRTEGMMESPISNTTELTNMTNSASFNSIPSQAGPLIDIPNLLHPMKTAPSPTSPSSQLHQTSPHQSSPSIATQKAISKETGRFPRELDVLQRVRFDTNNLVSKTTDQRTGALKNEAQRTKKAKRRLRKKRKFRLIPTFKHLENGRFVGR